MVEAGFSVKAKRKAALSTRFPCFSSFESSAPPCKNSWADSGGAVVFGWGRKAIVEERAKKLARMLSFIKHGIQTRTYDQFVASFSNPGDEPDVLERYDRKVRFIMHISESCWYSAEVAFPHAPHGVGRVSLQGGGDDFGVFITAAPADDRATVELHLAFDEKAGRDAKSMVRVFEAMPNWTRAREAERELRIEY
jgi:hypothetical protein